MNSCARRREEKGDVADGKGDCCRRNMPRRCRRFRREKMRGEKSHGSGQRSPRGRELLSHLLQVRHCCHHGAVRRPSLVRAHGGREGAREVAAEPPLMRGTEHARGVRGCATLITDNLIVGSQPQKSEDINHLKKEGVTYILNLPQDKDVEYWGIDLKSIKMRCHELDVRHMRRPVSKKAASLHFSQFC
ncbi:hypothetical protein AHAS_Ahas14G0155700 [Arachis hypogaea]